MSNRSNAGLRFYRSTREAFASERFPAVFGPYRRLRWGQTAVIVATMAIWAAIGVMLAWRG